MNIIKQKAQSWSIDVALGVIIFLVAFFVFYAILNANPNTGVKGLKEGASVVIKQFASEDATIRVIDKSQVNESRLNELKELSHEELKRIFRIEGDFCLYFEDEKGNIVLINNSYSGIGSSNINLGDNSCG